MHPELERIKFKLQRFFTNQKNNETDNKFNKK
jgi:hypothetical protein